MGNEDKPTHREDHKCEVVLKPDHCHPSHPAPGQHDDHDEHCKGEIQGTVTLHCDNHCHQLRTRTMIVAISPRTEPQLRAFELATFQAWENAGYLIMAHSLIDTGAGWSLTFTVAWYV